MKCPQVHGTGNYFLKCLVLIMFRIIMHAKLLCAICIATNTALCLSDSLRQCFVVLVIYAWVIVALLC